jgi:hypothetical protein
MRSLILYLLLFIPFVGIDMYFAEGIPVPTFFGFLLISTCYFMFFRKKFGVSSILHFSLFIIIPFISLIINDLDNIFGRFKGFLALAYCVAFAQLYYGCISNYSKYELLRGVKVCLGALVAFILIERFVPGVPEILHAVRDFVYVKDVYTNDLRDINDYGFVRPKLIFAEPAHLALYMTPLLWAYLLLEENRKLVFLLCILIPIFGHLFIGSPIFILCAGGSFSVALFKVMPFRLYLPSLVLFVVLAVAFLFLAASGFDSRTGEIVRGEDQSARNRIFIPYRLVESVLSERPAFGIGVSGTESAYSEFSVAYSKFGIRIFEGDVSWQHGIHFLGLNILLSFGIIGSLFLFLILTGILFRFLPIEYVFLFYQLTGLLQLAWGAYIDPYFWVVCALLFLVMRQCSKVTDAKPVISD